MYLIFYQTVRLSGGPNALSGTVEMYLPAHGAWGLVCDADYSMDTWPIRVCQQLGFGYVEDVTHATASTTCTEFHNFPFGVRMINCTDHCIPRPPLLCVVYIPHGVKMIKYRDLRKI